MQPYQQASEEIKRQGNRPAQIAKTVGSAASAAASLYSGGNILGKVLPMLSQYLPEDLAIKGLNKIDPRFGKFIQKALSNGQSFDEVRDFIGEKAEEQKTLDNRNIIEQVSPELFQFLKDQIGKGRQPIEAGAIAQHDKKFADIIKKLMKDHKTNWSDIIQSIFGNGQTAQPQQAQNALTQQAMQPPGSLPTQNASTEANAFQRQQGQSGQGQQAITAILQKIQNKLGA
jgi:hypothetical protein